MKFDDLKTAHDRIVASSTTFRVLAVVGFGVFVLTMAKHLNERNYHEMQRVFGENAVHFTAPAGPAVLHPYAKGIVSEAMDALHRAQNPTFTKDGITFYLTKGGGNENCHTRTLVAERNGAKARVGYLQRCRGVPDSIHIN